MYLARQNCMVEWSFDSAKAYSDPFNDVELDVMFLTPGGTEQRVPAFWAGEQTWTIRYSSPELGAHSWRSVCSDTGNPDLHGKEGRLEVQPYEGGNALLKRGPLRLSDNRRYLEHADGTPFFWLGDTWWFCLRKELSWPEDLQTLTRDRVQKGFSVIQFIAGPYPDMPWNDERNFNEAGFPWEQDFARVNPAYYDMADLRVYHLVRMGLVPCVFGCWGFHLIWMGVEKMKQHWRHLVARCGSLPVLWCLAGEGTMPFYLSKNREKDRETLKKGLTEIGAYLREIDPYRRLITVHPNSPNSARNQVEDPLLLDIDMLQTGHNDRLSIPATIRQVRQAYLRTPTIPVVNGEVCYEGIGGQSREEVQRFMFWICILGGACGHTYGANGLWQVNTEEKPFGPSPSGTAWGNTPWGEAYQLPGSRQLGLGKKFLERYEWWRFEPHPEWVEPHGTQEEIYAPFAGGIPGKVRVVFLPSGVWNISFKGIEGQVRYHARLFDPVTGELRDLGPVKPDDQGNWQLPLNRPPVYQDWVVVLEAG